MWNTWTSFCARIDKSCGQRALRKERQDRRRVEQPTYLECQRVDEGSQQTRVLDRGLGSDGRPDRLRGRTQRARRRGVRKPNPGASAKSYPRMHAGRRRTGRKRDRSRQARPGNAEERLAARTCRDAGPCEAALGPSRRSEGISPDRDAGQARIASPPCRWTCGASTERCPAR